MTLRAQLIRLASTLTPTSELRGEILALVDTQKVAASVPPALLAEVRKAFKYLDDWGADDSWAHALGGAHIEYDDATYNPTHIQVKKYPTETALLVVSL